MYISFYFRSFKWALSSDSSEEKDTSDASTAELPGLFLHFQRFFFLQSFFDFIQIRLFSLLNKFSIRFGKFQRSVWWLGFLLR